MTLVTECTNICTLSNDVIDTISATTKIEMDIATVGPATGVFTAAIEEFSKGIHLTAISKSAGALEATFLEALEQSSPISMLPNYTIAPSGEETGNFLVIDLGGSTLRVAVISLFGKSRGSSTSRCKIVISRKWNIDDSHKVVDMSFFEFVASKVVETLALQTTINFTDPISTAITWSFPLENTSPNTANVLSMGKGYFLSEEIRGRELKSLMESALQNYHSITMDVQAIVNDSLSVYAAARFFESTTRIAMVLGTGFNMCCELKASDLIGLSKMLPNQEFNLYNMEMSLFGACLIDLLATSYDTIIDPRFSNNFKFLPHMTLDPSTNTIFQPCELLTSGRYLPELVRLVLVDMIAEKEIFHTQRNTDLLHTEYAGFTGELMCQISETEDYSQIVGLLESRYKWPPGLVSLADALKLKSVIATVIRRSAFVIGISIIASLKLIIHFNGALDSKMVTIGYVGSVMEYFHGLRNLVTQFVNSSDEAVSMGFQINLQHIEESSLVGGAVAAASKVLIKGT